MLNSSVISQRIEPADSLDFFPTPPWATRALCEYIIQPSGNVIEPACGEGHMASPLAEYFDNVYLSDIHDYGRGEILDYLNTPMSSDWMITNPPFNLALEFILKGLSESNIGVAVLLRTAFVESIGRYNKLFKDNPPTTVAPFSERVPMLKGRLDRKAGTAASYSWFIWERDKSGCEIKWIKPCRKALEIDEDYSF